MAKTKKRSEGGIGLALSGGGFRATLFHLGVVRYLRAVGLLAEVRQIASVSGGSILAAHLALHWDRYCGTAEEFEGVSRELIRFCQRDVRGRIGRRIPLLACHRMLSLPRKHFPRSTTGLLLQNLRKLYGNVTLPDLKHLHDGVPQVSIVATNLTYPGLTLFEIDGVRLVPLGNGKASPMVQDHPGATTPLALAVAASAAYPAFFSPVTVSYDDLRLTQGYGVQSHTDGGVVDNQGLTVLLDRAGDGMATFVVSDATESQVVSRPGGRFGLVGTGLRAMELMMARIRERHQKEMAEHRPQSTVFVQIDATTSDERAAPLPVQKQLAGLRIDLDRFSHLEVAELVRHGFWVAHQEIHVAEPDPLLLPPAPPVAKPGQTVDRLRRGFALRLRLISWRDPIWLVYVLTVALLFVVTMPYLQAGLRYLESARHLIAVADVMEREVPDTPTGPPAEIELVAEGLERPTNPGFEIVAEHRVWDLRALRISANGESVTGSAFMTRFTELRRSSPEARLYSYFFETSGTLKVWLRDREELLTFRVKGPVPGAKPTSVNGVANLYPYIGEVDCARIEVGETFIIELHAEYSDAFDSRADWWIGMGIADPLSVASMRIIFPESLPFSNATFRRHPNRTRLESTSFDGTVVQVPGSEPELIWKVENPAVGYTYRVNWDWLPVASQSLAPDSI